MDRLSLEGYNITAYSGISTPYIKGRYRSNAIYLSSFKLYNVYIIYLYNNNTIKYIKYTLYIIN